MKRRALFLLFVTLFFWGCGSRNELTRCRDVLVQFQNGGLTEAIPGIVILPDNMPLVTVDQRVYLTRSLSGKVWFLFRTWRGKGGNLRGYLFTSGERVAVRSEVLVTTEMVGQRVALEMMVVEDLGSSWYRVSRDLD